MKGLELFEFVFTNMNDRELQCINLDIPLTKHKYSWVISKFVPDLKEYFHDKSLKNAVCAIKIVHPVEDIFWIMMNEDGSYVVAMENSKHSCKTMSDVNMYMQRMKYSGRDITEEDINTCRTR